MSLLTVKGDTGQSCVVPSDIVSSYSHLAAKLLSAKIRGDRDTSIKREAELSGSVNICDLELVFPEERWLRVTDLCLKLGVLGVR